MISVCSLSPPLRSAQPRASLRKSFGAERCTHKRTKTTPYEDADGVGQ